MKSPNLHFILVIDNNTFIDIFMNSNLELSWRQRTNNWRMKIVETLMTIYLISVNADDPNVRVLTSGDFDVTIEDRVYQRSFAIFLQYPEKAPSISIPIWGEVTTILKSPLIIESSTFIESVKSPQGDDSSIGTLSEYCENFAKFCWQLSLRTTPTC